MTLRTTILCGCNGTDQGCRTCDGTGVVQPPALPISGILISLFVIVGLFSLFAAGLAIKLYLTEPPAEELPALIQLPNPSKIGLRAEIGHLRIKEAREIGR